MATYASKKVQIIWGGVALTGVMDDSFVECDRNSDSFTQMTGADGETARSASADKSGKVTVRFLQTSFSNDILSADLTLDELTNLNAKSLFVKDGSGRSLHSAKEAWITKPAKVVYGKGIEGREWVFETGELQMGAAGN
jgi:Protein of unknown function (DUF3277)